MHVPNLREYPSIKPLSGCVCYGAEHSPVAARPAPARIGGSFSLGAVTTALTLAGLIGGLGYGAHALLQDLQRVGFAPLPLAPKIFDMAPLLAPPNTNWTQVHDPDLVVYEWAGIGLSAAPAVLPARDGPISDIDPETSGVFAPQRTADATTPPATSLGFRIPDRPNGGTRIPPSLDDTRLAEPILVTARVAAPPKVVLHATDETWIHIRDGEAVIFEGILLPGAEYEVPGRGGAPLLRTGNAGALYALVDGTSYGPVGSSSVLLKNMSLRAGDIIDQVPVASKRASRPGPDAATLRQTAVDVSQ